VNLSSRLYTVASVHDLLRHVASDAVNRVNDDAGCVV